MQQSVQICSSLAGIVGATYGPMQMKALIVREEAKREHVSKASLILSKSVAQHPISALIADVSKNQDEKASDGTCFVVLLLAAVLENARALIHQGMHPSIIHEKLIHEALCISEDAKDFAKRCSFDVDEQEKGDSDGSGCHARHLVESVLGTKMSMQQTKDIASIICKAINETDTETYLTCQLSLNETKAMLYSGLLFDRGSGLPPVQSIRGNMVRTHLESSAQETEQILDRVSGCLPLCIITEKAVPPPIVDRIARKGVLLLTSLPKDLCKNIAFRTGSTVFNSLEDIIMIGEMQLFQSIGRAKQINCEKLESKWFTNIEPTAHTCQTVVIRTRYESDTPALISASKDALRVALLAKKDGFVVPGGGGFEAAMSLLYRAKSESDNMTARMFYRCLSQSFEDVIKRLVSNSQQEGFIPESIEQLKKMQETAKERYFGIQIKGMSNSSVVDCHEAGLWDSFHVKRTAIETAFEAASKILRTDAFLKKGLDANQQVANESQQKATIAQDTSFPRTKPVLMKNLINPFSDQERERTKQQENHFQEKHAKLHDSQQ